MPQLGLLLVILWFFSLFVFRTVLQWWKTGSTGVRGFSGAVGSLEWNAGLLTSIGLVFGGMAPIASLQGWLGGALFFSVPVIHLSGAGLAVIGIVGALVAQMTMGSSWRVGVDETERTTLVTHGIFAWVRNPVFSFVFLSTGGLVLLVPNILSLVALVLTVVGIEIQVRAVEEPYLHRVHGTVYQEYCAKTGRFLPGVG